MPIPIYFISFYRLDSMLLYMKHKSHLYVVGVRVSCIKDALPQLSLMVPNANVAIPITNLSSFMVYGFKTPFFSLFLQTVFQKTLGHLISKTRCYACGKPKIPNMSYSQHRVGSSMFFCKDLYKGVVGIYGEEFDALIRRYWLGGLNTWHNLTY